MLDMSRREFLGFSAAGLLASACSGFTAHAAAAPAWEMRFKAANPSAIRLLQFTDVHFFNGVDKTPLQEKRRRQMTLDDTRRIIDQAKPDLLFVTGDLWHDNPNGRGAEFMAYALEQCSAWGLPWAFTWGNHDQLSDYAVGHKALKAAKHSLYGGAENGGNYVLAFEDGAGARLAEVFCLNTRHTGMDTACREFTAKAAETLDTNGPRPLRLGAFHIPLKQYEDVWENGTARGVIGETVCFEQEEKSSLPVLRDAGIQAVFCGHDHVNDYSGVLDGVDLIYGRATGYNGYGAEKVKKGAKLYTLDPARKSLEWVSLLPDGSTWTPKPEQRDDKRDT